MTRRRLLRDMSVATRLSIVALLVTLLSLAVTAAVGLRRGNQLADGIVADRLVTVGASRGDSIELYMTSLRREISVLALSPGTRTAIEEFSQGYIDLDRRSPSPADTETVTEFYLEEVVPGLEAVRGTPVSVSSLLPTGAGATALQLLYTVPDRAEDGTVPIDPSLVTDAGDGSAYSEVHATWHPVFSRIAGLSTIDDLFLIDATRDVILYTVEKRTDFATSLEVGPLSGSSLSTLIDSIGDDPVAGTAAFVDFTAYPQAVDRPRMFVASPVFDTDDTLVGYVAASVATDPLDAIMSGRGAWQGFGDTGEAYLVGDDGTMRTTARSYSESPGAFLAVPDEPGPNDLTADQRRRISQTRTTALVQPVARDVLALAQGGPGTIRTQNYRGVESVSAYRPLSIDGVDWMVFADTAASEIDRPIEDYARNMLFAVALFVVLVTFLAVRWSDRVMAPIRTIAARLRSVRSGDREITREPLPPRSPSEYVELADNIDEMLDRLHERRTEIATRSAERARLVAEFLPAAAAKRSGDGDDVLEHARNASATVLVLSGIGGLIGGMAEMEVRDILGDFVDQLDELTTEFGIERVKITGSAYYAVCGVTRPLLDHAPRSVGFALAAAEVVADLAAEHAAPLVVRAGVDSGVMSVGLTARGGLVYDAWGTAVTGAAELAHHAPGGTVAVSAAVREQLPREFVLVDDGADGPSSVVTGRVSEATT